MLLCYIIYYMYDIWIFSLSSPDGWRDAKSEAWQEHESHDTAEYGARYILCRWVQVCRNQDLPPHDVTCDRSRCGQWQLDVIDSRPCFYVCVYDIWLVNRNIKNIEKVKKGADFVT